MTNYYDKKRKEEIIAALSNEKVITESELYKNEELPALNSFAEALLHMVLVPGNYVTHRPITVNNLAAYLRSQAKYFMLEDDRNINYAADQIERLNKKIYALKRGVDGEALAKRAMFGINAPNRILTNLEFSMDDMFFETDAIVVNSKGITIVEVKNIRQDLFINENGALEAADGSGHVYCNIRMKLNNAIAVVRRIIEETFSENSKMNLLINNIQTVVLSTDGDIDDSRREFTIADCNSISYLLNNLHGEELLDQEEVNAIAKAISDASKLNKFPLKHDYYRVADAFALAEAKLEFAAAEKNIDGCFKCNDEVNESVNADSLKNENDNTTDKIEETNTNKKKKSYCKDRIFTASVAVILVAGMLIKELK